MTSAQSDRTAFHEDYTTLTSPVSLFTFAAVSARFARYPLAQDAR